jgi:PAS domain S-box-containing protein
VDQGSPTGRKAAELTRPAWWVEAFVELADATHVRIAIVRRISAEDAIVEWVNRATAELVHGTPEELAGRLLSEVYPAAYVAEAMARYDEARKQGRVVYEVVRELPAGRRTLSGVTIALADERYVAFAYDVTAEREAQRRLEQVTSLAEVGVFHWNVAEGSAEWSDETCRLLGYVPGAVDPSPGLFLQHAHPDDRQRLADAMGRVREGRPPAPTVRYRLIGNDERERTVDIRLQLVAGDDGRPLYALGAIRDVTDEVELERHAALVRRAEEQQRTALQVHDGVVQALSTVWLALDLGELERARRATVAATSSAQQVVADLLSEVAAMHGEIAPGTLRVRMQPEGNGS